MTRLNRAARRKATGYILSPLLRLVRATAASRRRSGPPPSGSALATARMHPLAAPPPRPPAHVPAPVTRRVRTNRERGGGIYSA
eukprot:3425965-Pyramimonas_sp.AAC.1